ncbi:MAG TPA: HAD-IA family hydrolase, partial [Amaricoccus sp.]|nr:HAD-IA family hydrolase [Amaricoccus sp.]
IDSIPSLVAAGNALLGELGRPGVDLATGRTFVGHGVARLVESLLHHTGGVAGELEPHVERFRAIYGADPVTGTLVYPGVPEALAALAAAGHGLGVCTQKPNQPALDLLRQLGLMPPLTGFTGGDSLAVLKPDPAMLFHTADQLAGEVTIMVGDSETDAETARRGGVPFLLHTEGYRIAAVEELPHVAAFDDFAELPRLVAAFLDADVTA